MTPHFKRKLEWI